MRSFRFGWTTLAALAFVVMVTQVSLAQQQGRGGRGGRQGGFGGPGGGAGGGVMSGARLAAIEPVEKALKLTDEQKDKIKDINAKVREDMQAAFQGGEGAREKMQEINKTAADDLKKVLDEGQQKRLLGITIQIAGAAAIADPAVAKELNVTEDQKKKLEEVRESIREETRGLFTGGRDQNGDREALQKKMEKMREDSNKKVMAVLTSEQQAQLEQLKGEKVEIDMAALRGGPGGGGRGDRQGGGRGNRGGRGERNPESKSSN